MFAYQIKTEIKPYKREEFDETMRSFTRKILMEKDCLGYSCYRDFRKQNNYTVIGEWKTHQAMKNHFKTQDFEVFIGIIKVLGRTFAMKITEVLKTGNFELARELITPKRSKSSATV